MRRQPREVIGLVVAEEDLGRLEFWARPPGERAAVFARLRDRPGPVLFDPPRLPFVRAGKGFRALVRHAEIAEASGLPQVFSSRPSAATLHEVPGFMGRNFSSLLNMDDPRHAKIRRVVARAFTPRMLGLIEDNIREAAQEIVGGLPRDGSGDFVGAVAARLPNQVICDLMGVPAEYRERVRRRTELIAGNCDPERAGVTPGLSRLAMARSLARVALAGEDLRRLVAGIARDRRRSPAGDVISALATANVDGERLTAAEIGQFFNLLAVAGSETTANAIGYGLKLLTDHPDQRELLLSDFDRYGPTAAEEIVRHVTPVVLMRRTVTRDHELGGQLYRKGDKVALVYASGNQDERVFADPAVFDVTRAPNPHLGFGGPGPHYCLGAHLARRELTILFRELYGRFPKIRSVGEPERLTSMLLNGVRHLGYDRG